MKNTLYFGDNLDILRQHIDSESVDLIYLDPPFNSNRDYNVLFKEHSGTESPAQIKAFGDTWNWAGAAEAWADFPNQCPVPKLVELMHGLHNAIGENDVLAYLVMMAPRLYQLHRVLKPTGSLYLHCDPTASHYLKLVMDCIFSPKNFGNEVIWRRTAVKGDARRKFGSVHDVIFRYTKSANYTFTPIYVATNEAYRARFKYEDERGAYQSAPMDSPNPRPNLTYIYKGHQPPTNGWRVSIEVMEQLDADGRLIFPPNPLGRIRRKVYLHEQGGPKAPDVWTDIPPLQAISAERLGYPTQKPLALLERIIAASSNPRDVVMDPFCGCGTAVVAAQKLGRKWIGIDITPIATSLIQKRLFDSFGAKDSRLLSKDDPAQRLAFDFEGLPTDLAGAKLLYDKDHTHKDFEMWAVGLIPAIPQEKKGADKGIDGIAYFYDNEKKPSKAVVQVKGGHVTANQIRDLIGVMTTQQAQLGFFVCLEAPTKPMYEAALSVGYYKPPSGVGKQVQAIQIRTIEDLLSGNDFEFPYYGANVSFQNAEQIQESVKQEAFEY